VKRSLFNEIGSYVVNDILEIGDETKEYLSLISLNSLFFMNAGRNIFQSESKLSLRWLEEVLKTSEINEKFILSQHTSPAVNIGKDVIETWRPEVEKEYERIIARYSHKIILSIGGHHHTFQARLPLFYHQNKIDSFLHINLCSLSPVVYNNPTYYYMRFKVEEYISFIDLLVQEVDLSGLITHERSFLEYIISDMFPVMNNRNINAYSDHTQWVSAFEAVINLFKKPAEDEDLKESFLSKYLMFMVGHSDIQNPNAQKATTIRVGMSLEDPYDDREMREKMYCSFITMTFESYQKCVAELKALEEF